MSLSTFFHSFTHILVNPKTAQEAQLAGTLVSGYNPGLGAIVEMIAGAAYSVETSLPVGTPGETKKDAVKKMIDVATPVVMATLGSVTGKATPEAAAVAPTIDILIDLVVGLFHALGVFTHATVTPATATPASLPPAAPAAAPGIRAL